MRESRWKGDFTLPVTIKGKVIVNFYDQNTPGNHLGILEEDVANLLPQYGGERHGNKVTWNLRGTSDFEFGVEQTITVEHEDIYDGGFRQGRRGLGSSSSEDLTQSLIID